MNCPPVLFLIFNRPEMTQRVFASIREASPAKLFIAADGPRNDKPNEAEICEQTRWIIKTIDWDCNVATLFREKNLGCKKAVSSAIEWFFTHVEEGIILEDDCLPSQSFFPYCQELLERYRNDTRIMQICGSNFLKTSLEESYYFSKYGPIWGWATWRRAWKYYDVDMSHWMIVKQKRLHYDFCFDEDEIRAREEIFDKVYAGNIDTWDYQWVFTKLIHNGLSITPKENLISNIGFSEEATHTTNKGDKRENLERKELEFPLVHPSFMLKNYEMDHKYFEVFLKRSKPPKKKFLNLIKKIALRIKFCTQP
jgi:hypothetical protein